MNYRLQFSPISGIRESQVDLRPQERQSSQRTIWEEDAKLYRSWAVYDSDMEPKRAGINWNMVLGVGLALAVSVGFWVAVGAMVARLLP